MTVETRKVQQLGPSTLAVTLPAAWTDAHGVEKGDGLTLREGIEGGLTVTSPRVGDHVPGVVVHVDELDPDAIGRAVVAQYVLGRRVIAIERRDGTLSSGSIEAVYRTESRLMGLGVVEDTPDRILVRCSVDASDFSLPDLVRRLERIGRTVRDEAVDALVHGDPEIARRARDREQQADTLSALSLRLIYGVYERPHLASAVGPDDGVALIGYQSVTNNLELAAEAAGDIADIALETDVSTGGMDKATLKGIRALTDRVNEMTAAAVESVVGPDFSQTREVRSAFHEVGDRQDAILSGLPSMRNEDLLAVRTILANLGVSAGYAVRNAEIAANVALCRDSDVVTLRNPDDG